MGMYHNWYIPQKTVCLFVDVLGWYSCYLLQYLLVCLQILGIAGNDFISEFVLPMDTKPDLSFKYELIQLIVPMSNPYKCNFLVVGRAGHSQMPQLNPHLV